MSVISNRHALSLFTAGESKPMAGQRLAKIGYKKTKDNPNPLASVCASLPQVNPDDITANVTRLLPYIANMIEGAQDGIIRSMYESAHGELIQISDDDISVDQCIAFLAAEAAGDRMSKDSVIAWFNATIAENLTVFLAEKLGFEEMNQDQMAVIEKHVTVYRDIFGLLASGKTTLGQKQINGVRTALKLGAVDDKISQRLTDRLNLMEKKAQSDFLDLSAI